MKKKRVALMLFAALVIAVGSLGLWSCETMERCEKDRTGEVTVINRTGYRIWVDVTWGGASMNDERSISSGSSTTYVVPAGSVKVWGSYDGWSWSSDYLSVGVCGNSSHTWHGKKSAELEGEPTEKR